MGQSPNIKPIQASYNDGITSRSQPVKLQITSTDLVIEATNGAVLDLWPIDRVHLVERPDIGSRIRLRYGHDRDDRITLDDNDDLNALQQLLPNLNQLTPGFHRHWRPILFWSAGTILSVLLVVLVMIPFASKLIVKNIPLHYEKVIGAAVLGQVINLFAKVESVSRDEIVCNNETTMPIIEQITENLSIFPGFPKDIKITVLNADMVNAFALPGGHIILLQGLLDFVESGDELSGVIAHEIAHIMKRHPLQSAIEDAGITALISLIVGDVSGAIVIAGLSSAYLTSAHSREDEREADRLGISMLKKAGINPKPMADFFVRLEKKEKEEKKWADVLDFLSTHPQSEERAKLSEKEAALDPSNTKRHSKISKEELQIIKSICPNKKKEEETNNQDPKIEEPRIEKPNIKEPIIEEPYKGKTDPYMDIGFLGPTRPTTAG